ncbi:MAG: hypothetical protein ACFB8W_11285 [Elainellaceae cyanobacterium]
MTLQIDERAIATPNSTLGDSVAEAEQTGAIAPNRQTWCPSTLNEEIGD